MKIKRIFRGGSAKCVGIVSAFIAILLYLHYISMEQISILSKESDNLIFRSTVRTTYSTTTQPRNPNHISNNMLHSTEKESEIPKKQWDKCSFLEERPTNITTLQEYTKFDFQPEWIKTKEYWDESFETRFKKEQKSKSRLPLKIIVVPHSHNDPGWLKTYLNYFKSDSREILNLIVAKMEKCSDMTFIWSEISFLQLWWDQAPPAKRQVLKQLVQSGRFEITTGGWVMTDEANVHLYAMIDQLIEGHQWVRTNLNVTPEVGWSIDPFGHGSTVPYLLSASNFEGTIIQRIHYGWKQWFAKHKFGDFVWSPFWKTAGSKAFKTHSLLTHNMPFDIYSIKNSCGPHPLICLNFDFRKIPNESTDYSIKAEFIRDENVAEKAHLLLEQYARTASVFPHNVALIPIGDDFRYNKKLEVEQQYRNYKKLIDHINTNKTYKAEISFGTPKDYFREIKKRYAEFPTLKGDFFVYSDVFTNGKPAYWSGYFTTRPFYKILSTNLEHNLRSAEILFTMAFNMARQRNQHNALKVFEKSYEKMILARRNLGLFQHHDAITGTSREFVMRDYGIRLVKSTKNLVKIQESAIEMLTQDGTNAHNFILSEVQRGIYYTLPRKLAINFDDKDYTSFIIYNSLPQERLEVIFIRIVTPKIKIIADDGAEVNFQINPIWETKGYYENSSMPNNEEIKVSTKQFEVVFVAKLPPLSLVKYKIVKSEDYKKKISTIRCSECNEKDQKIFNINNKQPGDIHLQNFEMRLMFDEKSGFLKTVAKKNIEKPIKCALQFASYIADPTGTGAYLFKTDSKQRELERDVLKQFPDIRILITSGPIASDVTVVYGNFLSHTVRIFNTKTYLDNAISIENFIDLESNEGSRELELFMRFKTQIKNGVNPEMFTDQNGFQFHRRVKVPSIGIEGNYFPITTSAFIQDAKSRLTLITSHAQGAASLKPGHLEVMLDRSPILDDSRGLDESVRDSRLTRHKFWLTIEDVSPKSENTYQVPSLFVNHLANSLRYPINIYFIKNSEKISSSLKNRVLFLKQPLPCDVHLLNLRTQTEDQLPLFPTRSAFMLLQRQGFDCSIIGDYNLFCKDTTGFSDDLFNELNIEKIEQTGLTGLNPASNIRSFKNVQLEPMELKTFNFTFNY